MIASPTPASQDPSQERGSPDRRRRRLGAAEHRPPSPLNQARGAGSGGAPHAERFSSMGNRTPNQQSRRRRGPGGGALHRQVKGPSTQRAGPSAPAGAQPQTLSGSPPTDPHPPRSQRHTLYINKRAGGLSWWVRRRRHCLFFLL